MSFGFSIGDILVVGNLAWKLYIGYHNAPRELQEVRRELFSLHKTFGRLRSDLNDPSSVLSRSDDERKYELGGHIARCRETLMELDKIHDKMIAKRRSKVQRMKIGLKDLGGIRSKLSLHLTDLSVCLTGIGNASLSRMEKTIGRQFDAMLDMEKRLSEKIEVVFQDWKSGRRREPSVLSSFRDAATIAHGTTMITTAELDEEVNEVLSVLEEEGVPEDELDKTRDFIRAFVEAKTEDEIGENLAAHTSNEGSFDHSTYLREKRAREVAARRAKFGAGYPVRLSPEEELFPQQQHTAALDEMQRLEAIADARATGLRRNTNTGSGRLKGEAGFNIQEEQNARQEARRYATQQEEANRTAREAKYAQMGAKIEYEKKQREEQKRLHVAKAKMASSGGHSPHAHSSRPSQDDFFAQQQQRAAAARDAEMERQAEQTAAEYAEIRLPAELQRERLRIDQVRFDTERASRLEEEKQQQREQRAREKALKKERERRLAQEELERRQNLFPNHSPSPQNHRRHSTNDAHRTDEEERFQRELPRTARPLPHMSPHSASLPLPPDLFTKTTGISGTPYIYPIHNVTHHPMSIENQLTPCVRDRLTPWNETKFSAERPEDDPTFQDLENDLDILERCYGSYFKLPSLYLPPLVSRRSAGTFEFYESHTWEDWERCEQEWYDFLKRIAEFKSPQPGLDGYIATRKGNLHVQRIVQRKLQWAQNLWMKYADDCLYDMMPSPPQAPRELRR